MCADNLPHRDKFPARRVAYKKNDAAKTFLPRSRRSVIAYCGVDYRNGRMHVELPFPRRSKRGIAAQHDKSSTARLRALCLNDFNWNAFGLALARVLAAVFKSVWASGTLSAAEGIFSHSDSNVIVNWRGGIFFESVSGANCNEAHFFDARDRFARRNFYATDDRRRGIFRSGNVFH